MFDRAKWCIYNIEMAIDSLGLKGADNYRYCQIGDDFSERMFEVKKRFGCCKCFEKEVRHPDGTRFKIGFNYGHS